MTATPSAGTGPDTPSEVVAPGALKSLVIPGVPVAQRRHSHVFQSPLASARFGVMLHYDDSTRDDWAVEWFNDPRCHNGYTWLVLDDGAVVELADPAMRTPHAGACREPNANSRFYGLSAATNGLVPATPAELAAIVATCVALFRFHGWAGHPEGPSGLEGAPGREASRESVLTRIVGHDSQAIWTKAATRAAGMSDEKARPLWGTLGRKVDPTGVRPDGRKIIDVNQVRAAVAAALRDDGGNDAPR